MERADDDTAINLALFKRYRFYHLFDPNGPKLFGRGAYALANVAFIAVVVVLVVFSALSFVVADAGAGIGDVDFLLIMFLYDIVAISLMKISVFLYHADTIWDLFDSSRVRFLTSPRCRRNVAILYRYREMSVRVTDFLLNLCAAVFAIWMAVPLALKTFATTTTAAAAAEKRLQNIFNLRYPVDARVYNENYYAFYAIEAAVGAFVLYYSILIDNFLISFCWTTIARYEVLTRSFESVEDDLGQSRDVIKLSTGFFSIVIQTFLYCYLFDVLNIKKDSVNFGIYSCDWTGMDVKFKKLLLFAMRMNNANRLRIKSSFNKTVNIQLFSNMLTTNYNIVSVMLKALNKKTN